MHIAALKPEAIDESNLEQTTIDKELNIQKELIASSWTVEEIKKYIRADSLGYLSIEGMLSCVKEPQDYCTACFDGNYPLEFSGQPSNQLPITFELKSL